MTESRINIVQGEYAVSSDPDAVIATLLGSCVSVCMYDSKRGVGGMNHFLLPGDNDTTSGMVARHGVFLMELLINGLLKKGVDKRDLTAKIFGGASTVTGIIEQIGEKNIAFARRFLQAEGIPILSESVGGNSGRRIQFWPVGGRARQSFIEAPKDELKIQKHWQQSQREATLSFSDNTAQAASVPLRVALTRVAEVQTELAAAAARIENVVSLLLTSLGAGQKTIADLQELDFARQSLENLGRLLVTFSEHVPEDLHIPAADVKASLNLGAIIGAILDGNAVEERQQAAGEVHLFDFG